MTERQVNIIQALADNNMSVTKAAKAMNANPHTLRCHIQQIREKTGKDPLDFRGLNELLAIAKNKEYIVTCNICGKKFVAPSHHYAICSEECREVAAEIARERRAENYRQRKEADKAWRKAQQYESYKKPRPVRLEVYPEYTLDEVEEMARERGMSYGKFVAMKRERI